MLVVLAWRSGTMLGELIGIEKGFERFGEWLKIKIDNSSDQQFVSAFVTASLTVCLGAITLLARLVVTVMTELATAYLSLIGSVLIFCVGMNLTWGKMVRVANMLPTVLLAVAATYLPFSF